MSKLFIGSLSYGIGDEALKEIFSKVGSVVSAKVIMNAQTGESRGFGFVEMSSAAEARKAIEQLNGTEQAGRKMIVAEARPNEGRSRERSSYGGRGDR